MKVSIIIPVYNVASYISDCLRSVLSQVYQNIEVIIVNDKTEDDSMAIVEAMLKQNATSFDVKIVSHQENRGLSAARNTGIKNSTGDYLYFLDSDDEITKDCIERLVCDAIDTHADIVVGDYLVQGSEEFYPPLKLKNSFINGNKKIINAYMREKIYVMAWNKLVRKDFITENQLYFKEGLIHEDCLWSFQCVCQAKTLAVVKYVTYIYKIRKNSITSSISFDKEFSSGITNLTEMVWYADNLSILKNYNVSSFLEEEKIRLLRKCMAHGERVNVGELYQLIRTLPHLGRCDIFFCELFKCRKLIRDAHYFLSSNAGEKYYQNVPFYLKHKKQIKCRFYKWFVYVLFCVLINKQPVVSLI